MSLEVHIHGPGFGETILLRWPRDGGGWDGGIVDAHARGEDGAWLVEKLRQLQLLSIEFAVATHPHLDHIHNFAAGLHRAKVPVAQGFYWPPFLPTSWLRFFNRLADQTGGEHAITAGMMEQWFNYWNQPGRRLSGLEGQDDFRPFWEAEVQGVRLAFKLLGPWDAINCRFAQNVANSRTGNGAINYQHRHANDVSLAMLVEYGESQIVLGGDMEDINWTKLAELPGRPGLHPSLVKVSHHGSSNGRINNMWQP